MKIIHHEIGRDPFYKIWNASEQCMIIYFYTDGGNIVFQNKMYPIKKGSLCFVRARKQHYTLPDQPEKYDRSKIFLPEQSVNDILNLTCEDKALHDLFRNSSVIYSQIPKEHREDVERIYATAESSLKRRTDVATFICCCFRLILYLRDFSFEHMTGPNNVLTRTIDFINRNYASSVTLDNICNHIYISKYYLCRSFKKAVGMTIMEYLLKTRIAAAKNLLVSDDTSIGEISEKCGFSGISYFSQIFKKNTGLTPIQYRKLFRESKNSEE